MEIPETTVCVVGAGPAGLVLSIGLALAGVPFVLLDADDGPTTESRALNVHPGAMEIFEDLDVADRLLDVGIKVRALRFSVGPKTLAEFPMDELGLKYPYSLHVRQQTTEAVLYDRLAELGHAPRARHWVTDVQPDGNHYLVSGEFGDERFSVRSRYVVGADGLPSAVRTSAGIGFPGRVYKHAFLIADVELADPLPERELSHIYPSRYGMLFYAPLSGGGWRIVISVRTKRGQKPRPPTLEELIRHIDLRGSEELRVRRMTSSSSFLFHHGVAEDFVRGGVVLIGDAAHTHSPAGGMGMNTGVQDGYDLAATFAAINRGRNATEALAAHAHRRRAAGLEVVRFSDRLMMLLTIAKPVTHLLRTATLMAVGQSQRMQRRIARTISCTTRSPWNTGAPALPRAGGPASVASATIDNIAKE